MKFSEWLQTRNENWYGTYCGPGPKLNPPDCDALLTGEEMPKPLDVLDNACKKHDIAYCKAGRDWKAALPSSLFASPDTLEADKELAKTVDDLMKSKKLRPYAQQFARLVAFYFRRRQRL
jgi:hypothetical protein